MASINLLPEDFSLDFYKKREKWTVGVFAVLLLVATGVSYVVIQYQQKKIFTEYSAVEKRLRELDESIKKEQEAGQLLSVNLNQKDISRALADHMYFSGAIDFLKDYVIDDVYVNQASFAYDATRGVTIDFVGEAKNYKAALRQLVILQNSYWVKEVGFTSFNLADNNKTVALSGPIVLKDDIIFYQERYWKLGVSLLENHTDRYFRINQYSASVKDAPLRRQSEKAKAEGTKDKEIVVQFSGECFRRDIAKNDTPDEVDKNSNLDTDVVKADEMNVGDNFQCEYLAKLKQDLQNNKLVVKDTVSLMETTDSRPDVTKFNGSVNLIY